MATGRQDDRRRPCHTLSFWAFFQNSEWALDWAHFSVAVGFLGGLEAPLSKRWLSEVSPFTCLELLFCDVKKNLNTEIMSNTTWIDSQRKFDDTWLFTNVLLTQEKLFIEKCIELFNEGQLMFSLLSTLCGTFKTKQDGPLDPPGTFEDWERCFKGETCS